MAEGLTFVPRIMLCGDEAEFLSRVIRRPFKLVGHVKFFGAIDGQPINFLRNGKVLINNEIQQFCANHYA